jgi:hypothetical protein
MNLQNLINTLEAMPPDAKVIFSNDGRVSAELAINNLKNDSEAVIISLRRKADEDERSAVQTEEISHIYRQKAKQYRSAIKALENAFELLEQVR